MHARPLLLAIVLSACGATHPPGPPAAIRVDSTPEPPPAPSSTPQRGARFEICRVDDDLEPFEPFGEDALPDGVTLDEEHAAGETGYRRVLFARAWVQPHESAQATRRRLEAFLAKVPLAVGRRFGLQHTGPEERDETGRDESWRSYVLHAECELDDRSIAAARMGRRPESGGWALSIELHPDAARAFAALTEETVHRRLAIVLDGDVQSAPVVMTPIAGGRLEIYLGSEPVDLPLQFASGVPILRD